MCLRVDESLGRHSNGSDKKLQKKDRPVVFVKNKSI